MNASWFELIQFRCYMPCHPKLRILVNSLGNETWDVFVSKYEGECGRKTRSSLDGWEPYLANIMTVVEAKYASHLIESS